MITTPMVLTWDEDATPHNVGDTAELDAYLDRLHAQAEAEGYPRLADIQAPDGATLGLTVGAEQSTVIWNDPTGHESTSRGPEQTREPMIQVTCYNQPSWLPTFTLIPSGAARNAAREFLTTGGRRPTSITWDTDAVETEF